MVQQRVQCCIQTLCFGFQFVLQFGTFKLLFQYICHSVECRLYCQFGSVDSTVQYSTVQCSTVQYSTVQYSTVLYTDCVVALFALPFETFKLLLEFVYPSVKCHKRKKCRKTYTLYFHS